MTLLPGGGKLNFLSFMGVSWYPIFLWMPSMKKSNYPKTHPRHQCACMTISDLEALSGCHSLSLKNLSASGCGYGATRCGLAAIINRGHYMTPTQTMRTLRGNHWEICENDHRFAACLMPPKWAIYIMIKNQPKWRNGYVSKLTQR